MKRPRRALFTAKRRKPSKAVENGSGSGGGSSSTSPEELAKDATKASTRGKRVKAPAASRPQQEPEFITEKRNLEDLWQAAFPVGTEWENMDKIHEINWNFSNLESAFEEGGAFYGRKVYMFGCTEPQLLVANGEQKIVLIPVVVAVVSPIPPSDKIGVISIQRVSEDIIPMKAMKMAWIPYIPLEDRQNLVERLNTQIFTLGCSQRRSALKHLKIERIKQYDYCLPYFQPLEAAADEDDTIVNIMYPLEPPVVCDFDWELDNLEDFAEDLIKEGALLRDQKDAFKEFVRGQVRERRQAQQQANEARMKAIADMDPETRAAFENMRFYKFYPVQTPDTPDLSEVKVPFINRYYGKAHFVM